jgi:hypothetical protein
LASGGVQVKRYIVDLLAHSFTKVRTPPNECKVNAPAPINRSFRSISPSPSKKHLVANSHTPSFTMVTAGLFVTALLVAVSAASIQQRQEARVISSCTVPNTVALTFVSVSFSSLVL